MVKYVGKALSGEWIAQCVIHRFSLEEGFTTDFYLKRNMVDEEFMRKPSQVLALQFAQEQEAKRAAAVAASNASAYGDEEEDPDAPECYKLMWRSAGGSARIDEALVDDEVTLYCETKNIADGENVLFKISEQGDPIDEVSGTVKDHKVQVKWKVVFNQKEGTATEEELTHDGYTVPEYVFFAEYNGERSRDNSAGLEVRGNAVSQVIDKNTKETLANREYIVRTPSGKFITARTNGQGNIMLDKLEIGDYTIVE
jgi:uncharacterized surface anchored protein